MSQMSRRSFLAAGGSALSVLSGCDQLLSAIPSGVILERDLEYSGEHELNKLDLYYCPALLVPEGNPGVMLIHGGLWSWGDKSGSAFPAMAYSLAQRGCVVASVNYRLAPLDKWPAMIDDCAQALSWLIDNSGGINIDASRLGVFGSSAGGQLSALLYCREDTRPLIKCNASLFGIYDLIDELDGFALPSWGRAIHSAVFGNCPMEVLAAASPSRNLSGDSSAFGSNLLIHGTQDRLVDFSQAEMFDGQLSDLGVDSQLLPFVGSHGLRRNFSEQWPKVLEFFSAKL